MVDRTAEHSTSRLSRSHDEGAYLNPLMALTHEDLGMLPNASTRTPRLSKILVLRLCLVGFLCNCQPSEPFLARYLLEDKGLTESELDNSVWPVDTYASLALLVPLGLLAESQYFGYRGVILLGLLCRQATRMLLLFSSGLGAMQAMQMTYAAATSAEAVYLAYPFVAVPPKLFLPASVAVRAAGHLGNALGSAIGQILVSFWPSMPLKVLFWLSWIFATAGLVAMLILPPPRRSSSSSRSATSSESSDSPTKETSNGLNGSGPCLGLGNVLWSGPAVVVYEVYEVYRAAGWASALSGWSAWWVFGTAASQLFLNYYQTLIYDASASAPFGLVEVLMEASAAIASTLPLLGANRLPPHSDNDRHLLPADTPSTAADRSDGGGGAVNRLWAWQQRLCLGAAGAFAVLCGFAVTPVWPPPLLWACASSVGLMAILTFQQSLASIFMALGAAAATQPHSPSRLSSSTPASSSEPTTTPSKEPGSPLIEMPSDEQEEEEPLEVRFAALFTGCTMAGLALAALIQATAPLLGASSTQAYMALAALLQGATLPCLFVFTALSGSKRAHNSSMSTEGT